MTTNLNGGSGSDTLTATSDGSKISAGSGDDTLIGGSGSDTLNGDAGNDLLVYNISQNASATRDIYTGGAGIDTVWIEFTLAQWLQESSQQQITAYLAHVANVTNTKTLQVSNAVASDFTFQFGTSTLTVQMMERLRVSVDGVEIDAADASVTAVADTATVDEDAGAVTIDVLANDSVADLVKEIAIEEDAGHGQVTLMMGDAGDPSTWYFQYEPDNTYYQYLAAGEVATDTFSYKVTDANGDFRIASVTVTISGNNDGPAVSTAVLQGTVTEDDADPTLTTSGAITFDDLDLIDTHSASVTDGEDNDLAGTLTASVTDTATGSTDGTVTWNYSVDNAATQYLADGETATETFTVKVSDNGNLFFEQEVSVTVAGANDGPEVTGADDQGAVTEDETSATLTDTGTITFDDADLIDTHSLDVTDGEDNTLGGTLDASVTDTATGSTDGTVTWNYSVDNSATQYLAQGETATESFTVKVSDNHSGSVEQDVTVTVAGTNDDVELSTADDAAVFIEDSGDAPILSDSGTITFSDVDLIDTHDVTVVRTDAFLGGTLLMGAVYESASTGAGTVEWTYSVENSAVQHLADGETTSETFKVTIADGHGGFEDVMVTATITGTNDAPVITLATTDSEGDVTEDGSSTGTLSDEGTITFDDVDVIDVHTAVADNKDNSLGGTLTASITDTATGSTDGTVTWEYSVDNVATQYLADGETATESFTVTVSDNESGTIEQDVTVTVTGVNDVPIISIETGDNGTAQLTDGAAALSVTRTLTVRDADKTNTVTASASVLSVGGSYSGGGAPSSSALLAMLSVTAGAIEADSTDINNLEWSFAASADEFDFLAAGETLVVTYALTVTDGTASDTENVTVTITGSDDPPTGAADNIITNVALGTDFQVPEWALLWNDTLHSDGALDVSAVTGQTGLTANLTSGSGSNGFVTVRDTGGAGGSFSYAPTDGSLAGQFTVATVGQDITPPLQGTTGSDILVSNGGSTRLQGGQGNDVLLSGTGNDTYLFGLADGMDIISDAGSGGDAIEVATSNPDNSTVLSALAFERVNDDLVMKLGSTEVTVRNHYVGSGAIESIRFTNGATFEGYTIGSAQYGLGTGLSGAGNQQDVIASSSMSGDTVSGAGGNDMLFGNGNHDTINGDNGSDLIVAGDGNDVLTGGAGADVLLGGAGGDVFMYGAFSTASGQTGATLSTADRITDFMSGADTIRIGTAGSAANYREAAAAGTFATALSSANTAMDGTVRYFLTNTEADGGLLFMDSNGDGTADALVRLTGITDSNFEFSDIIA